MPSSSLLLLLISNMDTAVFSGGCFIKHMHACMESHGVCPRRFERRGWMYTAGKDVTDSSRHACRSSSSWPGHLSSDGNKLKATPAKLRLWFKQLLVWPSRRTRRRRPRRRAMIQRDRPGAAFVGRRGWRGWVAPSQHQQNGLGHLSSSLSLSSCSRVSSPSVPVQNEWDQIVVTPLFSHSYAGLAKQIVIVYVATNSSLLVLANKVLL